ncbi:MAG: rod shape-determining protein [Oscillospiraceae bacterium]|nr:rod shape-determining protein [Oscillospiraceae bacterium]
MNTPDIGIDLGTANIVMTYGKKGVVLSEPSVIAYNTCTQRILAVGKEAYQMIGKTPAYIDVVHPLSEGVISDDLLTQCMIREFLMKVCGGQLIKPRIIICVPAFITELEKRAVGDAVMSAGCRKAYLIDEPIAAMLGAGINIGKARGHMVVDIGGGTTDVAIVSMNGIVTSHSVKSAGNQIDRAIMKYMQDRYKLLIGEQTAEQIKIGLTNLYDPRDDVTMTVKGRSIMRGLPDQVEINEMELFDAMEDEIFAIMEAIKKVLEETPPELVGDIHDNGILLTGGGSLLGGLRELIRRTLNVNCILAKDAVHCVAKGTGLAFQKINHLLDGFEGVTVYKYR